MTMTTEETTFGQILGELMRSRGIPDTREEMLALAERSGCDPQALEARLNGDLSIPPDLIGIGEELSFTHWEQTIIARVYVTGEGRAGDVRAQLFEEIAGHLDFVASLDEEDHGGSPTAVRIRKVLIPMVEVEKDLALHTE